MNNDSLKKMGFATKAIHAGNTENTKYHNDDAVKGTVILGDDKISTKQKDAISDIDGLVNNSSNNDDSLV